MEERITKSRETEKKGKSTRASGLFKHIHVLLYQHSEVYKLRATETKVLQIVSRWILVQVPQRIKKERNLKLKKCHHNVN
jgi:hypothetical protein